MSAHTPGPWEWEGDYILRPVDPDASKHACHTILSPEGPFGFVRSAKADVRNEFEADKALIAAAPELLKALKQLVDRELAYLDSVCITRGNVEGARNVIAKAERREVHMGSKR
jgi:hypothetical protein